MEINLPLGAMKNDAIGIVTCDLMLQNIYPIRRLIQFLKPDLVLHQETAANMEILLRLRVDLQIW